MLNLHERLVDNMAKTDELRQLIAETLKVNVSDIDDGFSLKTGRFKTSAGSVILSNIFRKVYGQKVDCKEVNTFGELLALADEKYNQFIINVVDSSSKVKPTAEPAVETSVSVERGQEQENGEKNVVELGHHLVCGIDIQEIDIFPDVADFWTDSFYTDNFTEEEVAYCVTTASPRHSFAGRWCVKEALHKCSPKYLNIPLKNIRVTRYPQGAGASSTSAALMSSSDSGHLSQIRIEVRLNGTWKELRNLTCSLSHADNYAVGMVTGWED